MRSEGTFQVYVKLHDSLGCSIPLCNEGFIVLFDVTLSSFFSSCIHLAVWVLRATIYLIMVDDVYRYIKSNVFNVELFESPLTLLFFH